MYTERATKTKVNALHQEIFDSVHSIFSSSPKVELILSSLQVIYVKQPTININSYLVLAAMLSLLENTDVLNEDLCSTNSQVAPEIECAECIQKILTVYFQRKDITLLEECGFSEMIGFAPFTSSERTEYNPTINGIIWSPDWLQEVYDQLNLHMNITKRTFHEWEHKLQVIRTELLELHSLVQKTYFNHPNGLELGYIARSLADIFMKKSSMERQPDITNAHVYLIYKSWLYTLKQSQSTPPPVNSNFSSLISGVISFIQDQMRFITENPHLLNTICSIDILNTFVQQDVNDKPYTEGYCYLQSAVAHQSFKKTLNIITGRCSRLGKSKQDIYCSQHNNNGRSSAHKLRSQHSSHSYHGARDRSCSPVHRPYRKPHSTHSNSNNSAKCISPIHFIPHSDPKERFMKTIEGGVYPARQSKSKKSVRHPRLEHRMTEAKLKRARKDFPRVHHPSDYSSADVTVRKIMNRWENPEALSWRNDSQT